MLSKGNQVHAGRIPQRCELICFAPVRVKRGCVVLEEKEVVDKTEQSSNSESIPPFYRGAPCYRKPLKARSFLFKGATMANRVCWASQAKWSNSAMWPSDREGRMPGAIAVSWVLCQLPSQTPVFTISDQGCYNHLKSPPLTPGLDRPQPTRGIGPFQHCEWTVHPNTASAHLSQLRLEFVLHICLLRDASTEG